MNGFTVTDPTIIPNDADILKFFGVKGIKSLGRFYGQPIKIGDNLATQLVNLVYLEIQHQVYMLFILKDRQRFDNDQQAKLSEAEMKLKNAEKTKITLLSVLSKRKLIKVKRSIKSLQRGRRAQKKIKSIPSMLQQSYGLFHLSLYPIMIFL